MEQLVIVGFGGHAKSIVDSIEANQQFKIAGFIDKSEHLGRCYRDYSVIGCDDDFKVLYQQGITNAVIAIGFMGNSILRDTLYQKLKLIGFTLPNIIDPTAVIAADVSLGEGIFIGKRAIINSASSIASLCIINTGAVIEHDCNIGVNSHVAVNATLCGQVTIQDHVFIGANTTVIQNIQIAQNCVIGAGALIYKNIHANTKVYGPINTGVSNNE